MCFLGLFFKEAFILSKMFSVRNYVLYKRGRFEESVYVKGIGPALQGEASLKGNFLKYSGQIDFSLPNKKGTGWKKRFC